jgi:hypothetical protein
MKKPVLISKFELLGESKNGPTIDREISAASLMVNRDQKFK